MIKERHGRSLQVFPETTVCSNLLITGNPAPGAAGCNDGTAR